MKRFITVCAAAACIGLAAGCAGTGPAGDPMPRLTFMQMEPVPLRVAALDIDRGYEASSDIADVSSTFPAGLADSVRRYAERRLAPAGTGGTLHFIVEDAHIHRQEEETGNNLTRWTGLDRSDLYDAVLRLRLYVSYQDGRESDHSILNFHRSLTLPQRYSLEEKDNEKLRFIEAMVDDADRAVVDALISKLNVAGR